MQVLETIHYIGRNRRSDVCMIEKLIELTTVEQEALSARAEDYRRQLAAVLQANGIEVDTGLLFNSKLADDAIGTFAHLHAEIALVIQQAAGHRVNFATTVDVPDLNKKRGVFEYEQLDVGHRADMLALNLLTSVIPELRWIDRPMDQSGSFTELFATFKVFARQLILPADAQAIIDAATQLEVPCVKLEREPYQELPGDFRIRKNGLLKLGHSAYQHILDGTFCIDKGEHLLPLLRDREQLFQALTQLQVPIARQDNEFRNCVNARRAARSAASIGYPVVVKPLLRNHGQGISLNVPNAEALQIAVRNAQQYSRKVMVEKHIEGETFKVIVANGDVIGVVSGEDGENVCNETHQSTLSLVLDLAEKSGAGMLVADIVTTDIGSPLKPQDGAIVDVDFAPELDRFLLAGSELHKQAMSAFVQWLYPQGARSRIPTIAITGTNGKTTTSRMITSIMQAGHFHTGFACSDGFYINQKLSEAGDLSGRGGHHRVFESREVNMGILETARGALAHSGFMFDWCNVSVCLNVTEDHLGEYGIETVEQMAELKRSVLESARDAVVLNADDELCISMLPFLSTPKICLVSMQSGVEELATIQGSMACFCILESIRCSDWLVLYDGDRRTPVIQTTQIPATFGGLAGFNICNALHAIAACYLMGLDLETVKEGLRTFRMSFESTPGRLNFYDEHPFTVIMDYAHNTDGISKLSAFVDQLKISGKKLLMFQVRGDKEDKNIKHFAAAAARHFDHYVCRTHPVYTGPDEQKVLTLMQDALLESGVNEQQITTTTDPSFAVKTMLQMGKKGDLLVFAPGAGQRLDTWNQITSFEST